MNSVSSLSANPLVRKLQHYATLSPDEIDLVERAAGIKVRDVDAHEDIIEEGDEPAHVNLMLSGWAYRYKQLSDGRRQILGYFLPGDLCDLRIFLLGGMDHSIATVGPVRIAELPKQTMVEMTESRSSLALALWKVDLVSRAIEREWIVNLGQRSAFERVGHLFCELYTRLAAVGLVDGDSCEMPLTQSELSDSVGLSTVHMNRTLQELRSQGLIALKSKVLTVTDLERLKKVSMFSPNYLHLHRAARGDVDAAPPRMFGV